MPNLTPAQNRIILILAKHCFINMYTDVDILLKASELEFISAANIHKQLYPDATKENIDMIAIVIDLFNIYLTENCALNVQLQVQDCHNNLRQLHENLRNLELDLKHTTEQQFNPVEYMRLFILIKKYTDNLTNELTAIIDLPLLQILDTLASIRNNINRAISHGITNHECIYFTTLRDCNEYIAVNYLKLQLEKFETATAEDVSSLQELSNRIDAHTQLILPQHEVHLVNRLNLLIETTLLNALGSCVDFVIALIENPIILDSRFILITSQANKIFDLLDHGTRKQLEIEKFFTNYSSKLVPKLRDSGSLLDTHLLLQKINALAFWKKYTTGGNLRRLLQIKLRAEQEYINTLPCKELLEYYDYVTENTIGVDINISIGTAEKDQSRVNIRTHMQRLYEIICERLDEISPGWVTRRKVPTPVFLIPGQILKVHPAI